MVTIGFSVVCVGLGLLWSSLFCRFAAKRVERIEGVGEAAYNMKWYSFPAKFQRYVILTMLRSQEDIHFSGWGMIYCNLEALSKVYSFLKVISWIPNFIERNEQPFFFIFQIMNSAVSYYLIFRELSQIDN